MYKKLGIIACGSMLIALGVNLFILPSHLLNGGMIGIGILLQYLWGFKVGLTIIFLNIPIYLFTLKHNPTYFYNSLYGLLVSSLMIELLYPLRGVVHLPILLSAFLGGLLIGFGIGLMLRYNTCPGGMDLLAFLLSKWSAINVGLIILVIDTSIIVSGLWILRDETLAYSLLTVLGVGLTTSVLTSFRSINVYMR